jgi:hypothetical protein
MANLGAAQKLLESIRLFNIAKDGDSGDEEHDAAVEMQHAAIAYLKTDIRDVALAELIDSYGDRLGD